MGPLMKLLLFIGGIVGSFVLGTMFDKYMLNYDRLYLYISKAKKKKYPLLYIYDGSMYHLRHVINWDKQMKSLLKTDVGEWIYCPDGTFAPLAGHNIIIGLADMHRSLATPIDVVYAIEDLKSRGVSEHELASFLYDVAHCRDYEEFKKKTIEKFNQKIKEVEKDKKLMEALRRKAKMIAKERGINEDVVLKELIKNEARARMDAPYDTSLFMIVKPELVRYVRTGINRLTICQEIELQRRAGELEKKRSFGFDPMWLIYAALAIMIVVIALGMKHSHMPNVAHMIMPSANIHKPIVIHPKPATPVKTHVVKHVAPKPQHATNTTKINKTVSISKAPKLKK